MIPLEDFFRKPNKTSLRLAPDGLCLAWLEPWQRRLNVTVRDLQTGQDQRVTAATARDVAGFCWVSGERLVYVQDEGGDENWHLFAVNRDGSQPLDLTPFPGVQCTIIDDLEDHDNEILLQMNRRQAEVFDVYRMNALTGELKLIAENPGNVQRWITDHEGRLRLATTTDGVNTKILTRPDEDSPWRTVATYDFKENAAPLFFTFDNQAVYVASNVGRDRTALFEYDLETGQEGKLLGEHPEVDVQELLSSRRRKRITGMAYETDRLHFEFFDAERQRIQDLLDAERPGHENLVTSQSREEDCQVVLSSSDRTRGSYFLLRHDDSQLRHLFDLSPWLPEGSMAATEAISLPTRDGLTLHGYWTRPPRAAAPYPVIVHPHGGPWHRDSWGFDPEVQFLASRGYAVLQVNFRGSTGYGRQFLEASYGQWGLTMQDDLTDAVQWTIDQGLADPERIGIYGASYGGFAALAGLAKTPELFACGVSYVGVSNLFTFMESIPPYWKPFLEMMHEMVGHPERDAQQFRDTSPLFQVDRIKAPLLVVQGANDPRVKQAESDQIVAALRGRGVTVEYLVKDNEGHGFQNEENQFEFYRTLESFLARHLGRDTG